MAGSLEDVFKIKCLMFEDTSSGFLKTERFFWDCVRGGTIRGGG